MISFEFKKFNNKIDEFVYLSCRGGKAKGIDLYAHSEFYRNNKFYYYFGGRKQRFNYLEHMWEEVGEIRFK